LDLKKAVMDAEDVFLKKLYEKNEERKKEI